MGSTLCIHASNGKENIDAFPPGPVFYAVLFTVVCHITGFRYPLPEGVFGFYWRRHRHEAKVYRC